MMSEKNQYRIQGGLGRGMFGQWEWVIDPSGASLRSEQIVDRLNGMHGDLTKIDEALKSKGLSKDDETPLGTILRLIETWKPEAPEEANCATGLKPVTFKAAALAQVILDLTSRLHHFAANHRMNNGLYPEAIREQMQDLREQLKILVPALAACEG